MARRELLFEGEIKIWLDGTEVIAELDNRYKPDPFNKQNYYSKTKSVVSAVESLFRELVEEGVIPIGMSDWDD